MSKGNWKNFCNLVLCVGIFAGCTADGAEPSVAQIEQAQNAIPNFGFIPYPIRTEEVEPDVFEPVIGPDGSYLPAWDGSLADLMAADAFADCLWNSSIRRFPNYSIGLPVATEGQDAYLQHLKSEMDKFTCGPDIGHTYPQFPSLWIRGRESPICNVDPQSGQPAQLEFSLRDLNQYASYHEDFLPDGWEDFFSDPDPFDDFQVFAHTLSSGGVELEYADLNLCMAQHLRAQLNGGQSLFTPINDQLELLGVIQERSQLAIVFYGLLAKVFSSQDSMPSDIVDPGAFLTVIRRWAEQADPAVLETTGGDFATAVRLHLEATYELARMLERQAATRPLNDVGFSRAGRDWGLGQPRVRLMNLLYGGDPLGTPEYPHPPGRSRGGVGRSGTLPAYVSADMQDPRVGTLLGLARGSDALLMKVALDDSEDPVGFDVVASAERMYRSVEAALRSNACELETPGEPSCDPAVIEPLVPNVSEVSEYLLWQEHRVDPGHATNLAQAFSDAFGQLVRELPTQPESRNLHRHSDGKLHLLGSHETLQIEGDSWIHVDPEFAAGEFEGHDLMVDFAELAFLPKSILLGANPRKQGFVFGWGGWSGSTNATDWEKIRNLGAIAALAFVREALVEGSNADAFAAPFFTSASAVLSEIDRAVGPRTVIVRPQRTTVNVSCGFWEPATCETFTHEVNGNPKYEVDVITRSGDPLDTLTLAPASQQLHTVAFDPESAGFDGVSRATLDGYPTESAAIEDDFPGYAAAYERRTFEYSLADNPVRTLLLRGENPETSGEQIYMSLFGHALRSSQNLSDEAYITSFGGALNGIGQRAASVLSYDWSRPAYDPFGFPADWVPPADASLVGGSPGEPSYQYYLRSAKGAAQEATAAVQKAIDTLVEETLIAVEFEAAEQRAAAISEIEMRSLCGPSASCDLTTRAWTPVAPPCVNSDGLFLSGTALDMCNQSREDLMRMLPRFFLPERVLDVPTGVAPVFSEFSGGEVQRILIRQWSAVQVVTRAVLNTMDVAVAVALEQLAADAAREAADEEMELAELEINNAFDDLAVGDATVDALLADLNADRVMLEATVGQAERAADRECSEQAYEDAFKSGRSYSNVKGLQFTYNDEDGSFRWDSDSAREMGWSEGPLRAQISRCTDAREHLHVVEQTQGSRIAAFNANEKALTQTLGLTEAREEALTQRRVAARARQRAAHAATYAAREGAASQLSASFAHVQQGLGEVLAAVAELDQARLRTENALAVANLERDLVTRQTDERFGFHRKFRSYDMWRARALLESSRRMSVAARRAIEARFVVDLSELQNSQAFVESPAIWADEVYGTDLDAPAVVGLSVAPRIENAVYPNQLLDYVGNLERFVQGYTVTYPTSVALPDTEVITLPGPERIREVTEVFEDELEDVVELEVHEVLSGVSAGWTFFCPNIDRWLRHPGMGQLPLEDRIATMCDGGPPTGMRYGFSLDPWGRLNGSIGNRPLIQRHNVRWRQLAVNLIGTGVRDCQRATNPQACFAESYLRFQLEHSGPSWAANHAQQWRAFNLPGAFIESGKALASEEWLDPIANSWNVPFVANVARAELSGRPLNGSYELIIDLSPDVRPERIEQVQLLVETEYWVRQQ